MQMAPIGKLFGYQLHTSLKIYLALCLFSCTAYAQQDIVTNNNKSNSADIIFAIENSGKMKILDPQNVRKSVCKRLVSLLDSSDRVSVVNFSSKASIDIPFTAVDSHQHISELFTAIDIPTSREKYSNWLQTLATIRDIINQSPNTEQIDTHVILVSIDPTRLNKRDKSKNLDPKITTELLPWFQSHKVKIHTITFSNDINNSIFKIIAEQTQGQSESIKSADALPEIFDKLLNSIKTRRTLAANTGEFTIEESTENFYLINQPLHGRQKYLPIQFTDPSGSTFNYNSHPNKYLWSRSDDFETIVINHPKTGHWTVNHETGDENFSGITLYTTEKPQTIALHYRFIPDIIRVGEKITVVAWISNNDATVTDPTFTRFLKAQLQIYQDGKLDQSISLYPMRTQPGKFSTSFVVKRAGKSLFELNIYDNSFQQNSQITKIVTPISETQATNTGTENSVAEPVTPVTSIDKPISFSRFLFTTQEKALLIIIVLNVIVIIAGLFVYFKKRRENNFFNRQRKPIKETRQGDNSFSFAPKRKTV